MSLSENNNNVETKIKIKRTRISKKALALTVVEAASSATPLEQQASLIEPQTHNNIQQIITPLPHIEEEDNEIDETEINDNVIVPEKVHKKRGRKPKGGKIIVNNIQTEQVFIPVPNVIMHLKCRVADLIQPDFLSSITYNPSINTVETFQFGNELGYDIIQSSSSSSSANDTNNDNNNNNMIIPEYSEPSSVDINHNNNNTAYNANDILSLTSSSSMKNNNNDERNSTHRNYKSICTSFGSRSSSCYQLFFKRKSYCSGSPWNR